jgi:hypothetical protein
MVGALEYDQRVGRRLKIVPLAVAARDMNLERAEPRGGGIENERNRIGDEPLGAIADEQAEHALSNQRVQFRQILVSVKRGFVHGSLSSLMWGILARM